MEENKMSADLKLKAWYIATTYSSHENKVAENIRRRIESFNLTDKVFRVIVAEEKIVTEGKDGKKKEKIVNPYAGYIFVEMIMTDETWYMVRNTPGVTGICGSSGKGTKPIPVPNSEIQSVLTRCGIRDEEMMSKFKAGDQISIIGGTFAGNEGEIIAIDMEEAKATISMLFFGRLQQVDVDIADIEKVQ
jgi:transcriptional antiterminator NusG